VGSRFELLLGVATAALVCMICYVVLRIVYGIVGWAATFLRRAAYIPLVGAMQCLTDSMH
jgi:hypothetical protein